MTIDRETVQKIAGLARLEVTESDIDYFAPQMQGLMKWIDQLQEVDTENVAPLASVSEIHLVWRADAVTDGGKPEDILANAPDAMENFFVVPKIVE
jgi:aspartyl-tRNA(Asn)/glutamyl-tRNA(Gln) amidotransferase subunit C